MRKTRNANLLSRSRPKFGVPKTRYSPRKQIYMLCLVPSRGYTPPRSTLLFCRLNLLPNRNYCVPVPNYPRDSGFVFGALKQQSRYLWLTLGPQIVEVHSVVGALKFLYKTPQYNAIYFASPHNCVI